MGLNMNGDEDNVVVSCCAGYKHKAVPAQRDLEWSNLQGASLYR